MRDAHDMKRRRPLGACLGIVAACAATAAGCRADRGEPGMRDGPAASARAISTLPGASASAAPDACSAGTVERRPLVLPDGTQGYVEPENLMQVGEDFVVVGAPTYTWRVGGTRVIMASANAHIAAYLDEDAPRMVDRPVDVTIGMVRSVMLDERRWAVLFSEQSPEESRPIGEVLRLWYGEYDGERWDLIEEVPMPDGHPLFGGTSSALVRHGGALRWTVLTQLDGAVFGYARREGEWTFELIQDGGPEAAAMAAGASGAWLVLSGRDPAISGPKKSLRLYRWESGWQLVRRDPTAETYTEIQSPSVIVLPTGVTVTWLELGVAGSRVIARTGIEVDRQGTLHVIDTEPAAVRTFPTDGQPAWVVQHVNVISGMSELRLVTNEDGGAGVAQLIPYPYTGWYAATASGPNEVLVTGSEFNPDPSQPTVRSLTLRLRPSCR